MNNEDKILDYLVNLNEKLDSLSVKFDNLESKVDERFDRVEQRLDKVEQRLDKVEQDTREIKHDIRDIKHDISSLDKRVSKLEVQGIASEARQEAIIEKLDVLKVQVVSIAEAQQSVGYWMENHERRISSLEAIM
ncbi:MAG: hypothetical protein EAZ92_03535 [Candidatus Kapaibacterium sp.]|nr:MAG: hypothetical protein EAZ92_03535 [Candidatus Kapabacteria bacterium]